MPEDPADLPRWMDEKLLAPTLPGLIEELRILYRPGRAPRLDRVLGSEKQAFLESGFGALPKPILAQCMRNPDLLQELQTLVFAEGGDYWFQLPAAPELTQSAERVAQGVRDRIWREIYQPKPRRWRYAFVSLATAAALLVALYYGGAFSSRPVGDNPGWGFTRIQQLPRNVDPKKVYQELATMAEESESRLPNDAVALSRWMTQYLQGCAMLQLAPDLPLPDNDRRWLKNRCADWSVAIEHHLQDLERGGDLAKVRAAVSATAKNIARELRERAA